MRRLALLLCACLLTAGCAGGAPDAARDPAAGPAPGPAAATGLPDAEAEATPVPTVFEGPFGWDVAVGAPGAGFTILMLSNPGNGIEVVVPEGATALAADAEWTCATPACPVDFYLLAKDGGGDPVQQILAARGAPAGSGDGRASFSVDGLEAGTYCLCAESGGATAQLKGTITVAIDLAP